MVKPNREVAGNRKLETVFSDRRLKRGILA